MRFIVDGGFRDFEMSPAQCKVLGPWHDGLMFWSTWGQLLEPVTNRLQILVTTSISGMCPAMQ